MGSYKININIDDVIGYANKGFSISQTARILKLKNDIILRRFINSNCGNDIITKFKNNGSRNKLIGKESNYKGLLGSIINGN